MQEENEGENNGYLASLKVLNNNLPDNGKMTDIGEALSKMTNKSPQNDDGRCAR